MMLTLEPNGTAAFGLVAETKSFFGLGIENVF
jgi:hypothetical protein